MNITAINYSYPRKLQKNFRQASANSISMGNRNGDFTFTPDVVERIMLRGGRVNVFGPHGFTPLRDVGVVYNRLDVCDKLLEYGANPFNRGKDGLTDVEAILKYSKSDYVKDIVRSATRDSKQTVKASAICYSDKK